MIFEAALTKDELMQGEQATQDWGVVRRSSMIFLTKSSAELEETSDEFTDATLEVFERLADYLKWREHETELLRAAQARMQVMLQIVVDRLESDQRT